MDQTKIYIRPATVPSCLIASSHKSVVCDSVRVSDSGGTPQIHRAATLGGGVGGVDGVGGGGGDAVA